MVYQRFYIYSQIITQSGEEESEVELDREVKKGIQGVEGEIYKRIGVRNIRLRFKK